MYRIGVDLGGTKIAAGIVSDAYEIICKEMVPTGMPCSPEDIAEKIVGVAEATLKKSGLSWDDIVSVGIGSPGLIDATRGVVKFAGNLDFRDVPLSKLVEEKLSVKKAVFLENDANAAAFGEYLAGSGRGKKNFIAVTLGTGVGGGIIVNEKLYSGSFHGGGEIGHMVTCVDGIPCGCGQKGCWEAYASGTALIRDARLAMKRCPESLLWELCEGDAENLCGKIIFEAMRRGDLSATLVVNSYLKYVAMGIINLITVFQPEKVAIGGGICAEGDTILGPIKMYAKNSSCANTSEIVIAELKNDAGIIGAAFLCQ